MSDDEMGAGRLPAVWSRVETWLMNNAPRTYQRLPAPGSEEEIRAAERKLGINMPADLRAFYLLHNGTGLATDFEAPVEDRCAYFLPGGRGAAPVAVLPTWLGGPVPIAAEANGGQILMAFTATDPDVVYGEFIDCTPGTGYGQVGTYEEIGLLSVTFRSFADYLCELADTLCGDKRCFDPRDRWSRVYLPVVQDGVLSWNSGPRQP